MGVHNFGVILHTVNALLPVFKSRNLASIGACRDLKSLGKRGNVIGVAHPTYALFVKTFEEQTVGVVFCFLSAVFSLFSVLYLTAERMRYELTAVTNSQHRHAQLEYFLIYLWRALFVNAVGSACKDNPNRIERLDFFH